MELRGEGSVVETGAQRTISNHTDTLKPFASLAFGLGLYWCWRGCVYSFDPNLGWMTAEASVLEMNLPCLGGLAAAIAMVLAAGKPQTPEATRLEPMVLGASCSVLTLASYVLNAFGNLTSTFSVLAQGFAFGTGLALLVCWGSLTVSMAPRDATLGLAGSLAVGAIGYLLVYALPFRELAVSIISLFPAASGLVSAKAQTICPGRASELDVARGAVPSEAWPCVVVVAVLVSFIGVEELLRVAFTLPEGEELPSLFTWVTQLGALVVSAAIVAVVLISKRTPSFDALARSLVPLMVVGFLSLLLFGEETPWLGFAILGAGYWCLRLLVWETVRALSRKVDVSPQRAFAAVEGLVCLVVMLAQLFATPGSVISSSKLAVVSVAVLAAVLGAMVILNTRFLGALENTAAPDPAEQSVTAGLNPRTTDSAVARLIDEHGLTQREGEVLALLARGRSLPYIQEELGIAVGTAQAHVRHIYDKLGVHNRQQLLDMVEDNRG